MLRAEGAASVGSAPLADPFTALLYLANPFTALLYLANLFTALLITLPPFLASLSTRSGSHRGTEFKPLKWTVPGADPGGKAAQSLYQLCSCKYTCTPPLCDATRTRVHPMASIHPPARAACNRAHAARTDRNARADMSLPLKHIRAMHACTHDHAAVTKICGACGWTPGTVLPTLSDPSST